MIQKHLQITILILGTVLSSAQAKINIEGKSFIGFITSLCVETVPPDPCAGYSDEMELISKKILLKLSHSGTSATNTQRKSVFSKWKWISGNQIKIENFNYQNKPFISGNILSLKNNQLIGKHGSGIYSGFHIRTSDKKRR